METTVTFLRTLGACKDSLILVELTLADGDIDPDDVLPDNAAGTDVQMAFTKDQDEWRIRGTADATHPTSELPMRPSFRPTAFP